MAIWDFQDARVCVGIGYLNVGTLKVMPVDGIGGAGGMRRGSEVLPRTPPWSRNDVAIVWVGPIWVVRPFGSHMARWLMHVVWSSFDRGRNVEVVGPARL